MSTAVTTELGVALGLVALIAAGVGFLWLKIQRLQSGPVDEAVRHPFARRRPWVFFGAFGLLPAVGFPISYLLPDRGTAFAE